MGTSDQPSAAFSRRRPTIDDVARLAGVGRGTVSRVINGGHNVRPAVRDAVNEAIDTLGYSVNQSARNLARGRTGSIAFVISEREERLFEDPNFGVFARTFSRQLRHSGRHLLITTAGDEEEENSLGDYLTVGHVDGALLALTRDEEPLLLRLQASRLPFVVLGKPLGFERALSWVAIDDEKAAFTAVSYLAGKVDGAIGTVTGPLQTSSGLERLNGYRRALGDRFRPDLVETGDWSLHSGRRGTETLLRRHPELRGLFVASDLMASGAIGALRTAGRRVPEDVAVVGFDDSAVATMVEPPLTTIRNPIEQSALEALRILDDQIAGPAQPPVQIILDSDLVKRSSA
jgi:DNA-binding LacI/PurR family transcriptional regulator